MSRAMTNSEAMRDGPAAELAAALTSCRGAFLATGLISGMSNVLMLTGAIFMLEIYDRVLPSRSVPTLVGLAVLAAGLYVALGFLDLIRGRILARIGISLDEALSGRLYQTIVRLPSIVGLRNDGAAPMRDLDSVRSFLGGIGPVALFDLPWIPVYLGICFAFHFWIGMTATIGALILIILTLLTEWLVLKPTKTAAKLAQVTQCDDSSRAGAIPRLWSPWAWSRISSGAGARSMRIILRATGARATPPEALAQSPRSCG